MYLLDTDVISELRKGASANVNVVKFLADADSNDDALYLSVVTIGELRRGVELIRHRNDLQQAKRLEAWLGSVMKEFEDHILDFGKEEAQVWGKLRVPHHENALDKQIAAIALTHGLTLVTRNIEHYDRIGLQVINPFK
jgi:predicted nucleic acid-binding protein